MLLAGDGLEPQWVLREVPAAQGQALALPL